ncbi:MAG: sugar phosphate isomerase/epimerase [Actinomycetota bacterium]|nr:sugar phosphate isomerase/epimerase [Actinomycetota bacterium]
MNDTDLQCSTGPFWAYDFERALDLIAEAGFTSIELMITRDPRTQEPESCLELVAQRGLRVAAVHGPFLMLNRSVWGLRAEPKLERGIELCRALGVSIYVVHPPYPLEGSFARWLARTPSHPPDVKVAVETMYPKWVGERRLQAYRWLKPHELVAHSPSVVMDTSHLALAREDILEAFEVLLPRLVHIHLSDQAGDNKDGHLSIGDGMLPIDRLLKEVARSTYSGSIALELSVSRYVEQPQELVRMLSANRELVGATLGLNLFSPMPHETEGLPRKARKATEGLPRKATERLPRKATEGLPRKAKGESP